jgi:DNA ligase-1
MQQFAQLYKSLDETNSSNEKILLLRNYFAVADAQDVLWAVALMTHKRPKRTVKVSLIKEWAAELSGVPFWLFEESYHIVGDLAETISHITPEKDNTLNFSLAECIQQIALLAHKTEAEKKAYIIAIWQHTNSWVRFVFNKLITGGFRVGVSEKLIVKALALWLNKEENQIAHRLMGNWSPFETTLQALLLQENFADNLSKPYPFFLAYALEQAPEELGNENDWLAEYKWDGIRGQIIVRNNEIFIWTRGEELVTEKYPELHALKSFLPNGTVLDGELMAYKNNTILSFQHLQKRIGRKTVSKKLLAEIPVAFFAYDILEHNGQDIRELPLTHRRELLEKLLVNINHAGVVLLSEKVTFSSWSELINIQANARNINAEGLMLKNLNAPYEVGRKKGNWWKWKVSPYTIDAVMIYAMQGHGRRANLFTDYTFAVWDNGALVPFAKAYSGLTDKEILAVDKFVKLNTIEKFGPVRSVKAELVFEIAFEGIALSTRHKSGIALRFPRIARWRKDKPAAEANTLDDLKSLFLVKENAE